jgi:soluble lytic murein transglycosylase-like protein
VRFIIVLTLLALTAPTRAPAQTMAPPEQTGNSRYSVCQIIEVAAQANALPVDFFTRVIWQESRLRADVVGP